MTSVLGGHEWPSSEEAFLALEECPERIELFDGSLYVTPAPTPHHQFISGEILVALRPAARAAGLFVLEAVNVRLRPGRIPIPDLVVTEAVDLREPVIEADAVRLVCEIVSPSNASADKILKMHYYAAAGIRWYLLVEQETCALHLYELAGQTYREHSVTRPGEVLRLTEPIGASLAPEALLPPL